METRHPEESHLRQSIDSLQKDVRVPRWAIVMASYLLMLLMAGSFAVVVFILVVLISIKQDQRTIQMNQKQMLDGHQDIQQSVEKAIKVLRKGNKEKIIPEGESP